MKPISTGNRPDQAADVSENVSTESGTDNVSGSIAIASCGNVSASSGLDIIGGRGTGGREGDDDGNPARPKHTTGTETGRLDQPNPILQPGDLNPNPPLGVWSGQRKDLFLPFLYMRTNPGDTGARPVSGPFWESPDILLIADKEPREAPDIPPQLGQTAAVNRPNTLYAHVWNFGQAVAPEVIVEFYWCDPSLGIFSPNLIGQAVTSLGARGSGRSHKVVKCPTPWVPTFVNGGHECLIVRVWEISSDPLGQPPWDARTNRHVAQRNIHVVEPSAKLNKFVNLEGAAHAITQAFPMPISLKVGLLYGDKSHTEVKVTSHPPHEMQWLQLRTGVRGQFPTQATATGMPLLSPPRPIGGGISTGGGSDRQSVTDDDQAVTFTSTDAHPGPGEAHVYRISATQKGQLFGGYTVVLLG